MTTIITRTAAKIVAPLIFITSIILFIQGHNSIGGGFIASVLIVNGVALLYIVYGRDELSKLFKHGASQSIIDLSDSGKNLLSFGLILIILTGILPIFFQLNLFTQAFITFSNLPLIGHFDISSSILFDMGVFLTITGSLLSILSEVSQ